MKNLPPPLPPTLDMDTIGQRIVALAEHALREHLESLHRSQAQSLLQMVREGEEKQFRQAG